MALVLHCRQFLLRATDKVFVVHGEPQPADTLRRRLDRELGWEALVPRLNQAFEL
jgi:metallo-beta-lactamase family protein